MLEFGKVLYTRIYNTFPLHVYKIPLRDISSSSTSKEDNNDKKNTKIINNRKNKNTTISADKYSIVAPIQQISAVEEIHERKLQGQKDEYHPQYKAFEELIQKKGGIENMSEDERKDIELLKKVLFYRTATSKVLRQARIKMLLEHYQRYPGDTGSVEVMIVLLTERINTLEFHLAQHKKDKNVLRPYHKLCARRYKFLQYLRKNRFRTYQVLVRDQGIHEGAMELFGRTYNVPPYIPSHLRTILESAKDILRTQYFLTK